MKCKTCKTEMSLLIGVDGARKEFCSLCSMDTKSRKRLEKIKKEVERDMKPLYDELGIDMETESLYWTNGEVFVKNKKTGKRREIPDRTQSWLNQHILTFGMENLRKK